jgi:hypothetical protein
MANRYWVGGTANWDGTAGTKWATTSGGAGGASVPTTADDVFFTSSSTGSCNIATGNTGAKSINCTGFTGTLTGSSDITVAGGITLVTGMTYSYTGITTFTGTGTLISAGKSLRTIIVSGAGITLTLGDALSCNGNFTVSEGNFNTANYSFTCAGSITSSTANLRSISLGSSTVTLTSGGIDFSPSTNLTFNAGTSQINLSSSVTIDSGGMTFYNVSYTGTTSGIRSISGSATFNNLTLTAPSSGVMQLSISSDLTVNGTLTCAGASSIRRNFIRSNTIGTNRTITAAVVSANDCDFRDITIAGAAAPISPTRGGNCGGNSGITFPASKTVYRVGTNTTWAGSGSWATSSGGAGADTNYPLPQDTAVIDNSTTLTGTLTVDGVNISALDCSSRTTGITLGFNAANNTHGSFTLGSGITVSGTSTQTFVNRSLINLVTAGKTITFPIEIEAVGGTVQLGDAFNSSSSVRVDFGTFNANNYNVTCSSFVLGAATTTRTVTMGSGLWTLTGTATVWLASTTVNLTFNKNTANILLSNTSTSARTFSPGNLAYNKLTIGGSTGTSTTTISSGTCSFTELASTKTVAHTILFSSDIGTIDTWSITGTIGNVVTVNSTTTTRRNFYLTNATSGINYLSVSNIGELNGSKFAVGVNSTDGGNNFNVYFSALPQPPNTMFLMFY